ncbi:Mitochondrial dicarboxylate carrier [Thelohanellus kitauei]|uniref:Mitochondrial dicarboxylate carrier n=1 Tax=Thelohanellus kitauei TaxID=669202 RepID=A0A0C2MFV2_THEKT|nr:Mitochondrial dicarboxylate carrier [Thelohanellus kitauei]
MSEKQEKKKQSNPWYLGGVAGCMAVAITHPFDLIKVHLQTQTTEGLGIVQMTGNVIKNNGVSGLYNGISAALLRQATYTTTRFGLYEILSDTRQKSLNRFAGGVVGNPADKVNVRMQNDMKLPINQRRNYKHVIDGLIEVYKKEGVSGLMAGYQTTASRGCLMTVGQFFIQSGYMTDCVATHLTCSSLAAICACFITQPLDVIKTNVMNNKDSSLKSIAMGTLTEGKLALFKGLIPAFARLAPQTILQFLFLEQLKKIFMN